MDKTITSFVGMDVRTDSIAVGYSADGARATALCRDSGAAVGGVMQSTGALWSGPGSSDRV